MDKRMSNKVVVVTGASTGIGRATALHFARLGAAVVAVARSEEDLGSLVEVCENVGGRALAAPADVTDEEAVRNVARRAFETFGHLDVWVNNAAVHALGSFEQTPPDVFRRVIETNLFGYIHGMRAALPYFRERGEGIIINVASVVGETGQAFASAYATSKAAIMGLSESVRMELMDAPGIHVCRVLPATIDTPIFQHAANYSGRAVRAMPPVYGPEQVAEAIVSLARKPRPEVTVGGAGKMMVAMHRIAPALTERVMARQVDKTHFRDRPAADSEGNVFEPRAPRRAIYGGWRPPERPSAPVPTRKRLGQVALGASVVLLAVWGLKQRRRLMAR